MTTIVSVSFKFENVSPQKFPFSKPIMNYIFENASSKLFKKFNQSCKFFFANFDYNIIDSFRLVDYIPWYDTFYDYKFRTNMKQKFAILKSNLWLTKEFSLNCADFPFYQSLFPKIIRCNICRLSLYRSGDLPFEYFAKLTESGKVDDLTILNTKLIDFEGSYVPIEEIFKCVLKAHSIAINPTFVTNQTMEKLNLIKNDNKLCVIYLKQINNMLDADSFIKFINSNFDHKERWNCIHITFENEQNTILFNNRLRQKFRFNILT